MEGFLAMDFTVNLWSTHPAAGNDDCDTSADFATEAEARAAVAGLLDGTSTHFSMAYFRDSAFVELDGPGCHEVVERPGVAARARRRAARDAQDERSEAAMQAGMEFGVDGYNDAMGW
jgi:hypothetical protein